MNVRAKNSHDSQNLSRKKIEHQIFLMSSQQTTLTICLFKPCSLLVFLGAWPNLESIRHCPRGEEASSEKLCECSKEIVS